MPDPTATPLTYERDGVVKVSGLLSHEDVAAVREALVRYTEQLLPTLPEADYVLEADGKTVRNFWRLDKHDSFFREIAQRASLRDLLRPLLHGEPVLLSVETFNKPSRIGSGVPPHQDNAYFCLAPPDALTVWIAIDPVTAENGPVSHVVGSYHEGIRPHTPSGVSGNSMGLAEPLGDHEAITPTLSSGDALIHHAETIHYSGPNNSDAARCVLLMVFRAAHCAIDPTLKQVYEHAQR